MKRSVKIILIIVFIVLVGGTYFGYKVYQSIMGSEQIVGKQEGIPQQMTTTPPVTTGIADWTNWRGPNFEGKSATKGILTDWSKGLQKLWHVKLSLSGYSYRFMGIISHSRKSDNCTGKRQHK